MFQLRQPLKESGYYYFNTTGSDQSYYIYSPGIYTLQSGFSTGNRSAIRIGASNVVLEGNAQTISGNAKNEGVVIEPGLTNITVRNFAGINLFDTGINSTSEHVSLINASISDNDYMGVYTIGSDFLMQQCVIRNSTEVGIFLYGYNGTLNKNNLIGNPNYAFYSYSNNLTIIKNSFIDNAYAVYSETDYMLFDQNTITNSTYEGAAIWGNWIICSENVCTQNPTNLFLSAHNSTIKNNTLSSARGDGIFATGQNTTISENTISECGYGIFSMIKECKAINNRIYSSKWYGIIIQGDNGTISDNIVRDTSHYGIACSGKNSKILNNIITNATYGVEIYDNFNSTVIGNQINRTTKSGPINI